MHIWNSYGRFNASLHFFLFWTIKFVAFLFHKCFLNIFIISCVENNYMFQPIIFLCNHSFPFGYAIYSIIVYDVLENNFEKH
jgi:hypothetical protein